MKVKVKNRSGNGIVGYTIPDMVITVVITIVFRKLSELGDSHSFRKVQNIN